MKRFKFRLQPLLNIKQTLEKQIKNELAIVDQQLFKLEEELSALKREFLSSGEDYRNEMHGGLSPQRMMWFTNYFAYLKDLMWAKRDEILEVKEQRRQIQLRLVAVMREIKVLEKLKENHYRQYLKEVQMEEEKELGDIMSYKASVGG